MFTAGLEREGEAEAEDAARLPAPRCCLRGFSFSTLAVEREGRAGDGRAGTEAAARAARFVVIAENVRPAEALDWPDARAALAERVWRPGDGEGLDDAS